MTPTLTTAHGTHYLQNISVLKLHLGEQLFLDYFAVVAHGHMLQGEAEGSKVISKVDAFFQFSGFAVYHEVDHLTPKLIQRALYSEPSLEVIVNRPSVCFPVDQNSIIACLICRAASPGCGELRMLEMTATPAAPAAKTSEALE